MESREDQSPSCRYTDPECKKKFAAKLMHTVKTSGFQQLRMDDIAKQMDISKATMYKYFSSKEEIVCLLVDMFIKDVVDLHRTYLPDTELSYARKFQRLFTQSLMMANYGSEPFLRDLRETSSASEAYERLVEAISERNEQVEAFYTEGMDAGAFYRLNPTLLLLEDEAVFGKLVDPVHLMKYGLSLRGALTDYYEIRKRQLLAPETFAQADDAFMNERLDAMTKKILIGMV